MSDHDHPGSPREVIGDLEVCRISGDIQNHADLSTRSKARKQALDILFEADARGVDPLDVLAARPGVVDNPVRPFAADLVREVQARRADLEAILAQNLRAGWTLERMPRVDRVLALLGAHEILDTDTPNPTVVAEAVELAGEFSTDDSPTFLNGLLVAVSKSDQRSSGPLDGVADAVSDGDEVPEGS